MAFASGAFERARATSLRLARRGVLGRPTAGPGVGVGRRARDETRSSPAMVKQPVLGLALKLALIALVVATAEDSATVNGPAWLASC